MSDNTVQYVDGIPIPAMFPADKFRSALAYKPNSNDLFLVTYPKCGTTWTGQILLLLFQKGEQLKDMDLEKSPFLEMAGAKRIEIMSKPGIIKSHLPFHLIPWSKDAKYIYVARNPKDCCVSFFHYSKHIPGNNFEGTFDQFFEYFMTGLPETVYFGDYFDHVLSWYSHRNNPNVLFVTYEELKEDIDAAIMKMASFIDDEKYAQPIRENPEILENIKQYSSVKAAKEFMTKQSEEIAKMSVEEFANSSVPDTIKEYLVVENDTLTPAAGDKRSESNVNLSERFKLISELVRKGVVGDWKNYFSEDQSRRIDEKFEKMAKGTDLSSFFTKYM
ncbi:sulfotransferase 1E1 [Parasteatoda tepidariorum]|uniref:sulfotransferase 1E1 n=1 Tax=Parasteatoda tepidariorum TaxID=114398 RepID=UPI001C71EF55|nr:sulfotransferase 1E1-like [Parasteatoda tepidariorum]